MACQFFAKNGQPSNLYDSAAAKYNEQTALSVFTTARTPEFNTQYANRVELDANGEPTLKSMETLGLVQFIPDFVLSLEKEREILDKKVAFVETAFTRAGVSIVFEEDTEMEDTAKVMTKNNKLTIKFNPAKARKDSIFHEAGHAYIDMMGGLEAPIIQQGIKQLQGTKLWKDVALAYPELNPTQLAKEVLTTAIGIEASKLFDAQEQRKGWQFWVNRLAQKLADLLGVQDSVATKLAKDLVRQDLSQTIDGKVKVAEQKQKDFRLINNVFQTKTEFLTKAKQAIAKKIETHYRNLTDEQKLRNVNYQALKQLESSLTAYAEADTNMGIIAFVTEAYKQTGLLEGRIDKLLNPTVKDIEEGVADVTARDIKNIMQYNATFNLIEDLNDIIENEGDLKKALEESGVLGHVDVINRRFTTIKKQTKRMAISLLAKNFADRGRGKVEATRREAIGREYDETHAKERTEAQKSYSSAKLKTYKEARSKFINAQIQLEKRELYTKEVERFEYLLQQANSDISWMDKMFIDGDALNDDIINVATEILDEVDFNNMTIANEEYKIANALFEEFSKVKTQWNQEEKYDEMIEDAVEYRDGKLVKTGAKGRNMVSEYYSAFLETRENLYNLYLEAKESGLLVEEAYSEYQDFVAANTKSVYTDEYYRVLNSLSEEARAATEELKNEKRELLTKYRTYKYETGKYAHIYDASKINSSDQKRIDEIDMELQQLKAVYNTDGKAKVGRELAIAQELAEYDTRVGELYEEGEIAQDLYETAKGRAAEKGEEHLAGFLEKNTEEKPNQLFWDQLNWAMGILGSRNKETNKTIKALLKPYRKKDGTYAAELIPASLKKELQELEKSKHTKTGKDGVTRIRRYNDAGMEPEIALALEWMGENMYFYPTEAYKKAKEEAEALGEEAYAKWFDENHVWDYYNNQGDSNFVGMDETSAKPLSFWTVFEVPEEFKETAIKSNWKITKIKDKFLTGVPMDEHGAPNERWRNPQHTKLAELRKAGSPIAKMYDYLINRIEEDDKALPPWAQLGKSVGNATFYGMPAIKKVGMERYAKDGIVNTIKEDITSLVRREDSTEYGTDLSPEERAATLGALTGDEGSIPNKTIQRVISIITNEGGEEKFRVPINFRYQMEAKDQSYDLLSIMLMNQFMSLNFANKENIAADLELTGDLLKERDVVQTRSTMFQGTRYLADRLLGESPTTVAPVVKKGIDSNAYKAYQSMIEDRLYGIASRTGATTNQIANRILGYTGNVMLIGNYLSAGANLFYGDFTNWLEAAGAEFFDKGDMSAAHRKYMRELATGAIVGDIGALVPKSKTNLLIEKFNMLGDWRAVANSFVEDSKFKQLFKGSSLHALNNMAEHFIQSILMYAMLNNTKVMNSDGLYLTKTGTTTDINQAMSLDDAYTIKDGRLVIDPRVASTTHSEDIAFGQEAEFLMSRYMRDLNAYMQGQYSHQKRAEIQRYWWGNAIIMLRKWLPRGLKRRWRGASTMGIPTDQLNLDDRFYSRPLRTFQEGYYTTTGRFVYELLSQGKALKWQMVTTNWSRLTDGEQANIKKAVGELVAAAVLLGVAMALKGLGDDEEDPTLKKVYFTMAFFAVRLQKELVTYVNPVEVTNTVKSPTAALIMIDRAMHFVGQLIVDSSNIVTGGSPSIYKTGRRKGDLKIWKDFTDLVPLVKNLDRNIEESLSFLFNKRM
jgi:hypothetical protein